MGISGLLPFLKRSTRAVNVREFSGCVAAIDSYCWLHRGAFACADRLARGQQTDVYVQYCLRLVSMLQQHGVTPLMVFDGCSLPSKRTVELDRRSNRQRYRTLAAEHLRAGRDREAQECFQRCVDVTQQMALALIVACRARGVDCLVAPYEADAQLAYLSKRGLADVIITEDSDLVVFGCERVLFKMDAAGNGRLVESQRLHLSLGQSADKFSLDKLRLTCVLSGCDYLPSLPGIGLMRASKLFLRSVNRDLRAVLSRLPSYLGMRGLVVSEEYIDGFERAVNTFLHQLVFDPLQRCVLPLCPYPSGRTAADYPYAGEAMDDRTGFHIALGNMDLNTKQMVADYNPDVVVLSNKSIWSRGYVLTRRMFNYSGSFDLTVERRSTTGKRVSLPLPSQLTAQTEDASRRLSESQMLSLYSSGVAPKSCASIASVTSEIDISQLNAPGVVDKIFADDSEGFWSLDDLSGAVSTQQSGTDTGETAASSQDSAVVDSAVTEDVAPQDSSEEMSSPVLGSTSGRNPFRMRGPVRACLNAGLKRPADAPVVTSKYFSSATAASAENTSVPSGPLVTSLEEVLRRRREAATEAPRKRRRSGSVDAEVVKPSAVPRATNSWYRMSSVFDSKHAMSVWDSEVHGLRDASSSSTDTKYEEDTRTTTQTETSPHVLPLSPCTNGSGAPPSLPDLPAVQPGARAAQPSGAKPFPLPLVEPSVRTKSRGVRVATPKRPRGGSCRKPGLAKPAATGGGRQLNLDQLFAFQKPVVAKLKH